MKKIILGFSITILFITISIFIFLQITVSINKSNNQKVVETFNKTILEQDLALADEYDNNLPKLEINDTDYLGIINIPAYNLSLPLESKCQNTLLNNSGACTYSIDSLIILGTTLRDSFYNYKLYNVFDQITFTNTLGQTFQYKIDKIKRVDKLENISLYNEDLIIAIKDYYAMKYILLVCNLY